MTSIQQRLYTQHISTTGTSNENDGCWAHLSPRMRVKLTSSPTCGSNNTKNKKGRRVALMSDILKVQVSGSERLSVGKETVLIEILNHPAPFILV